MIAFVKGKIVHMDALSAIMDVSGVGYRIMMAGNALQQLSLDQEIILFTSYQLREDSATLYGFLRQSDSDIFEKLITVSGVGPKAAQAFLGTYSSEEIIQKIQAEDLDALSKVPGIGKKTAGRIVLDLKGKLVSSITGNEDKEVLVNKDNPKEEAIAALLGMGFSYAESSLALKDYDGVNEDLKLILKYALSKLGGS